MLAATSLFCDVYALPDDAAGRCAMGDQWRGVDGHAVRSEFPFPLRCDLLFGAGDDASRAGDGHVLAALICNGLANGGRAFWFYEIRLVWELALVARPCNGWL